MPTRDWFKRSIQPDLLDAVQEKMHRRLLACLAYYPLLVLLFVVLIWIYLTHWLGIWILVSLWALGWALWCMVIFRVPTTRPRTLAICLTWMNLIALAYSAIHHHEETQASRQLSRWNQFRKVEHADALNPLTWTPIVVHGKIEQSLRYRRASIPGRHHSEHETIDDWQTTTILQVSKILDQETPEDFLLKTSLVIDGRHEGLLPGDTVEIFGHWRLPPEPSNPGQFDLRNRFAELGIAAQIKTDSQLGVRLIHRSSPWRLDRWLAIWSHAALLAIDRYVVLEQAPLTAALVLGQREQADWLFQEKMLATGTIHMLSISGMHIEMVALALLICGSLVRAPKGPLLVGTVLVCIIYAMLCGANPPVARATIMLAAACMAKYLGWPLSSLNTLAFAALAILAARTSVAFEVGTQLSFLTVSVLILTFPLLRQRAIPIQRLIENRESVFSKSLRVARALCWESMRSSFWVSFISAPLVWCSFHIISPISILLNLLLWLPMLIALLAGLGLVMFFWIPPLAWFLGSCCGVSLWCLARLVQIADSIPFGHFWFTAPPNWWLATFYAIALAIALWLGTKRSSARRAMLWGLGCWFLLGFASLQVQEWFRRNHWLEHGPMTRITFFDVGHGTCVLIQPPDGNSFLYDAGRLGDHQRSYQPIAQALWSMGVQRIDGLLLSHADSDHYNAMPGLRERFPVKRFITTLEVLSHPSPSIRDLLDIIERKNIPIQPWRSGSEFKTADDFLIRAIYPANRSADAGALSEDQSGITATAKLISDNATSLCLLIQYAQKRILLPGDLENPGSEELTSSEPLRVDVLMAPHHGSLTAKQDELIAWCQPSSIIISGSHKSLDPRTLDAYSPNGQWLFHTARDHALQLRIDPSGKLDWYHWQDNRWQTLAQQ